MIRPILTLGSPILLRKNEYEFLFILERKDKESEAYGKVISFVISYYITKAPYIDRRLVDSRTDILLVVRTKQNEAFLGHGHYYTSVLDLHVNPPGIGLGSIILNHLFYFAAKECPEAMVKSLNLTAVDEKEEDNRLRRNKLYENLGFQLNKKTNGDISAKGFKLSNAKINLDKRDFSIQNINVESLKRHKLALDFEIKRLQDLEKYCNEIKALYNMAKSNIGYKYSDKFFCFVALAIIVAVTYCVNEYIIDYKMINLLSVKFIMWLVAWIAALYSSFFIFLKLIDITSYLVQNAFKKDYREFDYNISKLKRNTPSQIKDYLKFERNTNIFEKCASIIKNGEESYKSSENADYIFDLIYDIKRKEEKLYPKVDCLLQAKGLIGAIKEIYQNIPYILARLLKLDKFIKKN